MDCIHGTTVCVNVLCITSGVFLLCCASGVVAVQ